MSTVEFDTTARESVNAAHARVLEARRALAAASVELERLSPVLADALTGIECPPWCLQTRCDWRYFNSEISMHHARIGFQRFHEGIQGDWFVIAYEEVLIDGERKLTIHSRSKRCNLLSFSTTPQKGMTVAEWTAYAGAA